MSLRKNPREFPQPVAGPAYGTDEFDVPMTARQIAALKTLAGLAGDTDAFDETLTKGEATRRITALEVLLDREQHSGKERLPRT